MSMKLVIVVGVIIGVYLFSATSIAALVQAQGNAVIGDEGRVNARQSAMQDAMRQAAIQAGARVQSTTETFNSVVTIDNVRVRAIGVVREVVVLDEWVDDDNDTYHVLIRANVIAADSGMEEKNNHRYGYKVAVTQFQVPDRLQIHDLPNIEILLAQEIVRRLQINEGFYAIDASQYLLSDSMGSYTALGYTPEQIIVDMAARLGVQFVISGLIKDFGVTRHLSFFELRHAEIEIFIHDGVSGALISRHQMNGSTLQGEPFQFPVSTPVLADKFFASPIGKEIHRMINGLIVEAAKTMKALPFVARVLQTRGKKVYFDVGATSRIQVGDVFMAFKLDEEALFNPLRQQFFGFSESPATSVVVKQVQPLFAMAEVETDNIKLAPGDIVRFSW
ncbi:MAG: hypothetical protein GXP08_09075 [Gammaproteobacteria bacterium]|nr:hypothetical protein [Gammaproteobacteria bacterium]